MCVDLSANLGFIFTGPLLSSFSQTAVIARKHFHCAQNFHSVLVTQASGHSWQPTILRDAESMQNVMQDHENLHLAE